MRWILVGSLLAFASTSAPTTQTWRELYALGDFEGAAGILHRLVLEDAARVEPQMPDADASEALSRMYLSGSGVEQDMVLACSFARLAMLTAMFQRSYPADPRLARIERLAAETCEPLSRDEAEEAAQMTGCPAYGPAPQTYEVGVDHTVAIGRGGIRIRHRGKEAVEPLPRLGCPNRLALVRYTRLDPHVADADIGPRHLIELFEWTPAGPSERQTLRWLLAEIVAGSVELQASEQLGDYAGSPWMRSSDAVPADVPAVRFAMRATGEIMWRFDRGGPVGVLAAVPEAPIADPAPRLPESGAAHVDVTVNDRLGAPLTGATVTLAGVVNRDATVNDAGRAAFDNLPDGRYDIVASAKGLASAVPRVIDLSGPGVTDIHFTLKPPGPIGMVSRACGGYDPRSIRSLGDGSDLILHVQVTGTRPTEERADHGEHSHISTLTDARVVRSMKRHPLGPSPGAAFTLQQGGGRIDRGDYIDSHTFNRLPPLNVGDEYVLFVKFAEDGTPWISGSEEGAFRIRNGRVEPLGGGGAAVAWKGRASARFFEELEKRFR